MKMTLTDVEHMKCIDKLFHIFTVKMQFKMKELSLGFVLFAVSFGCSASEVAGATGLSIDQVFDPNSGEVFLQRKYVVNVPAKSEECYYIHDVVRGQKLNFHYLVYEQLLITIHCDYCDEDGD